MYFTKTYRTEKVFLYSTGISNFQLQPSMTGSLVVFVMLNKKKKTKKTYQRLYRNIILACLLFMLVLQYEVWEL